MRLLFVHQRLGAFGGAESNILTTAGELHRRGHVLGFIYDVQGGGQAGWGELFEFCRQLPRADRGRWAADAIREFNPDAIYLHTCPDLEVITALLDSACPVVRMVHDHDLYCLRSYKYNYFTRKPCRRPASPFCVFPCFGNVVRNSAPGLPIRFRSYFEKLRELELNRRCERCIVYSDYSREELVRNGFDRSRIHIHVPIRCGPEDAPPASFSSRNLILYAGQIIRGKGVDVLLRALARVQSNYECLIVGEGRQRGACERLSRRLGLAERVRFAGYVPQNQLRECYRDASVFVLSSVWPEPFGMSGPEAMLSGLPVVAFDAGGISEWLTDGQNGFLVPWMDVNTYAAKIDELLRNKTVARAMGRRGAERVRRDYEASRQVDVLEKIFLEVSHPDQGGFKIGAGTERPRLPHLKSRNAGTSRSLPPFPDDRRPVTGTCALNL